MQKRFCSCGYPVLVEYVLRHRFFRAMFKTKKDGQTIHRCPNCGQTLNINEVR